MIRLKDCPFCGSLKVDLCRTNARACWVRCCVCDAESLGKRIDTFLEGK